MPAKLRAPALRLVVYPVDARHDVPAHVLAWLDAEERARHARFVQLRDRHLFAWAHACLRHELAAALACVPEEVSIVRDAAGKPMLDALHASPLHFSLSHTRGCVAIALSSAGPVGADVERIDVRLDVAALAERVLHAEEQACGSGVDDFFRVWTLKEAYAKAHGLGLRLAFAKLRVVPGVDGLLAMQDYSRLTPAGSHAMLVREYAAPDTSRYALAVAFPVGLAATTLQFSVQPEPPWRTAPESPR